MHEKITVFDEYVEWTDYRVHRGVLNTKKYKGMSAAACAILNYSTWIILTPWFIAHRIAYHNHNETPNTIGNILKYLLAFIGAMIYDIPCVVIGGSLLYTMITSAFTSINALGGIGLLIASLFVSYPFLKTGLCRLPDLFSKEPRPVEFQEPEYSEYEADSTEDDNAEYWNCEEYPAADDEVIDIDEMDGATFEHFCADLLRVNGWTDVQITPASGDHGIDITAEKDDIKWGFQCKRWGDTKVDAIAIGQTYKGKALYECDMVAVITTSTLTAQAEGEAKQLGIKVWGRGKIRQLMSKLDNADDYYLSA